MPKQTKKFHQIQKRIDTKRARIPELTKEVQQAERRLRVSEAQLRHLYQMRRKACHHPTSRKEYGAPDGYAYMIQCNTCQGVLEMPKEKLPSEVESDRKLNLKDSYVYIP